MLGMGFADCDWVCKSGKPSKCPVLFGTIPLHEDWVGSCSTLSRLPTSDSIGSLRRVAEHVPFTVLSDLEVPLCVCIYVLTPDPQECLLRDQRGSAPETAHGVQPYSDSHRK